MLFRSWYGETYNVSGNYEQTFTSLQGCDSIVTLHLTINETVYGDTTATACHTFTWYGETYNVSGNYEQTFTSLQGCDSIIMLHLTINEAFYGDTTAVACNEFTWYGETYNVSAAPRVTIAALFDASGNSGRQNAIMP